MTCNSISANTQIASPTQSNKPLFARGTAISLRVNTAGGVGPYTYYWVSTPGADGTGTTVSSTNPTSIVYSTFGEKKISVLVADSKNTLTGCTGYVDVGPYITVKRIVGQGDVEIVHRAPNTTTNTSAGTCYYALNTFPCTKLLPYGNNAYMVPKPAAGQSFVKWFDQNTNETGLTGYPLSFTMTEDKAASAQFTGDVPPSGNTFTITSSVANTGGTISPLGTTYLAQGTSQIYTIATSSVGYTVATTTVDGINLPFFVNSYTFSNVQANHTIQASFTYVPGGPADPNKDDWFTITPSSGANGNVVPSIPQTVYRGDDQSFSFVPAANYRLTAIYVDGALLPNSDIAYLFKTYYFYDVQSDHTIRGEFGDNSFKVTAVAGQHGRVEEPTIVTVAYDGEVQFDFTPDSGYEIDRVADGGTLVATSDPFILRNVRADHNISVTFKPIQHTLGLTVTGPGKVTVSGSDYSEETVNLTYADGVSAVLKPVAETNAVFRGWRGDVSGDNADCPERNDANCTLPMFGNRVVTAQFSTPLIEVAPIKGSELNPAYMIYSNPPKTGGFTTQAKAVTIGIKDADELITRVVLSIGPPDDNPNSGSGWGGLDKVTRDGVPCPTPGAVFTNSTLTREGGSFSTSDFYLNFPAGRCQPNPNATSPYANVGSATGDYRKINIRARAYLEDGTLATTTGTIIYFRLLDPVDRPVSP